MIKNMKLSTAIIGSLLILLNFMGCAEAQQQDNTPENEAIFAKGELGSEENFTGNAWHTPLVENDSLFTTLAGNVAFEAGARSNWHSHPAGQILLVTAGKGYHQVDGEPKEIIRKGDVVQCPPNVNHWHGASADSSMTHIYIIPNTEKGIVEWGDPVTDEEFDN
jgi:quercetin dioxygenase-like cupin family protein